MRTLMAWFVLFPLPALSADWSVSASWEVVTHDLVFESDDGLKLAGSLHVPADIVDGPAIVLVQQAGIKLRDFAMFDQLVDTFTAAGYSVFAYDLRGHGESEGTGERPRFATMAADAVAAKRAIAAHDAVDGSRIGYWGISQAGWLAMMAATLSDPAFVISVSTPLTTPLEQMEFLAHNYVLARGFGEEAAEQALHTRRIVMDDLFRGKASREEAIAALEAVQDEPWFELAFLPRAEDLPEDLSASTWVHEMDFDPIAYFEGVDAPMLFVLGGEDIDIPVARMMDIIDELEPVDNRHVIVIPGADHGMRIPRKPAEHPADDDPQPGSNAATYFFVMGEWLGRLDAQTR